MATIVQERKPVLLQTEDFRTAQIESQIEAFKNKQTPQYISGNLYRYIRFLSGYRTPEIRLKDFRDYFDPINSDVPGEAEPMRRRKELLNHFGFDEWKPNGELSYVNRGLVLHPPNSPTQ